MNPTYGSAAAMEPQIAILLVDNGHCHRDEYAAAVLARGWVLHTASANDDLNARITGA